MTDFDSAQRIKPVRSRLTQNEGLALFRDHDQQWATFR
jgi:hypothetical protein